MPRPIAECESTHWAAPRGRYASRRARPLRPASTFTRSCARSISHAAGTERAIRPAFSARRASRARPVRIRSSATGSPIRRGSRTQPPNPGTIPSSTSGNPIWVRGSSLAIRESHASVNSAPPPRHTPSIAATVGTGRLASRPNAACARRISASACSRSVIDPIASMSAPAMNDPGLPLTTTTPVRSGRPVSEPSTDSRSASACWSSTFTRRSGWSITRWTIPPACGSRRNTLIRRAPPRTPRPVPRPRTARRGPA